METVSAIKIYELIKGVNNVKSTDLVKNGGRPEMMFKLTLSPDGTTYQKEVSLVFPKYASADLPHYKEGFEPQAIGKPEDCQWHFQLED